MPATYPSREAFEQDFPNIKGTGIGPDRDDEYPELIVLVTRKYAESELDPGEVIPNTVEIDGTTYVTDVESVGIPHALGRSSQGIDIADYRAQYAEDHRERHRPIPGGVSIGNDAVGAGTMGSPLLEHEGDPVTLSNAHVAGGAHEQYQPAGMDGGAEDEVIGTLREASELNPRRTQTTDSALIDVEPGLIDDSILGIGPLAGIDRDGPDFGRTYLKSGRTTGVTQASLRGRDVQINVAYGPDTIRFTGCDLFGAMSAAGDSGSLIGYPDNDDFWATDLLFAGSDQATIAIPFASVESHHGPLTIPEEEEEDEEDDTDVGGDEPRSWGQFRHPARLTNVVDGDTMDFEVHHGPLDLRQDHRIRLLEVDTAERGTDDFDTHTQFATDWLDTGIEEYGPEDDPEDPEARWPFILETYRDEMDSFGRLLTGIRRKSDGQRLRDAFLSEYGEAVRYELEAQLEALLR